MNNWFQVKATYEKNAREWNSKESNRIIFIG